MSAHAIDTQQVFAKDNVYLSEGAGKALSRGLVGLGAAFIAITIAAAFMGGDKVGAKVAIHALLAGNVAAVGLPLGCLGLVMILHQVNAGWTATIRRQFENVMSLMPYAAGLFIVLFAAAGALAVFKGVYLWDWMDAKYVEGDILYEHKRGFLNAPFFYIRSALYFLIWVGLAAYLWGKSTTQDQTGDKWLTADARKVSSFGLLLFAFTTAFAGFDWVMTLDYHWFSTMFGVYFFAGNMVACLTLVTFVLITLRAFGRLHVAFTDEHLHDLSKLIFAFTVFWAYISFSQYFLIWYANIPEETAWMMRRKEGPWEWLSWALPIGHFIVPFLFMIHRPIRRNRAAVALACIWLFSMHLLDSYWAIRPEVKGVEVGTLAGPAWVDPIGVLGPVLVIIGLLIGRIASGPLMPLKDPRLGEGLGHKNYV
jgi:hypothetical protein